MKHEAIYQLHTNVKSIDDNDDGTVTCYDANGNVVTLSDSEETAVTTKATELHNARELKFMRNVRNQKLAETDYWDSSDTPAMSQAQIDYRQALRDITDNYTSLDDVVWPTKP